MLKVIDCGYSLETPRRGGSNEYPPSMFEQKHEKYQTFYLKLSVLGGEIFNLISYCIRHYIDLLT